MHSKKIGNTKFHFNSDGSGNLVMSSVHNDVEVEIPFDDVLGFVVHYLGLKSDEQREISQNAIYNAVKIDGAINVVKGLIK